MFSEDCAKLMYELVSHECTRAGECEASLMRLVYCCCWEKVFYVSVQRVVSSSMQNTDRLNVEGDSVNG